jgi:transposase
LGRSRGGFSTKIHVSVDSLGNPLCFRLTAGQRHDITQAEALLPPAPFDRLIADRSYDAANFLNLIAVRGAEAVIPPHPRRKHQRDYDTWLYRERHLVECFFHKLKQYRHIFSRFDKLARRYLGFLNFIGVLIWLR